MFHLPIDWPQQFQRPQIFWNLVTWHLTLETLITLLTIENNNINNYFDLWIKSDRDSIRNSCDFFTYMWWYLEFAGQPAKFCTYVARISKHYLEFAGRGRPNLTPQRQFAAHRENRNWYFHFSHFHFSQFHFSQFHFSHFHFSHFHFSHFHFYPFLFHHLVVI